MQEWPEARLRLVVDGNGLSAPVGENDLTTALVDAIGHSLELYTCPNAQREHGIPADEVGLDANLGLGSVVALALAARRCDIM